MARGAPGLVMGPCIVEIDRIVIREVQYQLEVNRCRNEEVIVKGNFGWAWSLLAGCPRIDRIVIKEVQYQFEVNRCRNEEVNSIIVGAEMEDLETHILVRAQTVHVSARDISVTLDTFEWSPGQRFPFQLVHVSGLLPITRCNRCKTPGVTQVNPIDPSDPSRPKSTQDTPSRPKSTQVNPSQPKSTQVDPSQPKSTQADPSRLKPTQVNPSRPKSTQVIKAIQVAQGIRNRLV
ncbi:hypothetical protein DPMN_027092 [Dreissena polymorpha]|uniref:Uncharacterized protein n=1 Tax=Dreissena polymorpha TaxID=45954 RepID=A0A9D4LUK4_DREPO|nr:hypothetical protein DPMN_027092 [Dreissena polymorpha]